MKLKYNNIEQLSFSDSEKIDIGSINTILSRFSENDIHMFSSNENETSVPGIWENRWYNDPNNSNLYYKKGESVWINTEDIDEFIKKHEITIREYASHNAKTRSTLVELDKLQDQTRLNEFYKKIINGYNGNDKLFYLGDIKKPVQIMISLQDNNNSYPEEIEKDSKWKSFFIYQTDELINEQIDEMTNEILGAEFQSHLRDYHMIDVSDSSDLINQYVKSDFSNISNYQHFNSHNWYTDRLNDGFDSVKLFIRKKYKGGYKWFRLWESGFLEHGGVIDPNVYSDTLDSIDTSIYTVRLNWLYNGSSIAKSYDFGSDSINNYYLKNVDNIDIGESNDGTDTIIPIQNMILGSQQRYSISITPFNQSNLIPFHDGKGYERYISKEVCQIDNDKFSFFVSSNNKYSYYLTGFTRP